MKKLSVYIDQNTLSELARDLQWRRTELGTVLLSDAVDVFISPVHVLETMQAAEAVRIPIAKVMLALCEGRRMCPSYEFIVADYFCRALGDANAAAVTTREHLDYHKDSSTRLYLGALALLAEGYAATPSAIDEVRKAKLVNQALHTRAATAPREWLAALLECTTKMLVTSSDPLAPLDALTAEELRSVVNQAAGANAAGVDADIRRKLQKHRGEIAAAYGAVEIGACLDAALPLPGEMESVFDANGIATAVQKWGVSQALPAEGAPRLEVRTMIQRAILASAKNGLLPASISNEVVLREIENAASAKETPNVGVVFDADHAVYLCHMNIFVTDDEGLRNALRPIARRISTDERPVDVCGSADVGKLVKKLAK